MHNQKGFSHIYVVFAAIVLVIFAGFYYFKFSTSKQEDLNISPKQEYKHPKLDSKLYQLATTKSEQEKKALNVSGDQVQVVIEVLDPNYVLAPEFGTVEVKTENRIQAKVYINKLLQLADDPKVRSIQEPMRAVPANQ